MRAIQKLGVQEKSDLVVDIGMHIVEFETDRVPATAIELKV